MSDEINTNENPTMSADDFRVTVGAEFYNIFCKTGASATPAQFKEFEKNIVRFIFNYLNYLDIADEHCNFTTLVNSYIESLSLLGAYKQFYDATPEDIKKSIIATVSTAISTSNTDSVSEEIVISDEAKGE